MFRFTFVTPSAECTS